MREDFGEVALSVSVFIHAIIEEFIASVAHMLTFHAYVLTRHIHIAFVTEEIAVPVYAIADLLVALITIMLGYGLMGAIDYSVTTVAVVVLVLVYVLANKLSVTFVAVSVVIVINAVDRQPHAAPITDVISVRILMVGVIRIFFTPGLLTADVAGGVPVLVDMVVARKLGSAFVARPIAVSIYTYVRHPTATLVT